MSEVIETCGQRRGGSERNRMGVAAGAGPAGGESDGRDRGGVSGPGERVTPSDDRRAVRARFDDATEVGRRGAVGFRLHDVHHHAVGAYCRGRFGVEVGDGVLHRVGVYARRSESRQGGDGKVIVMNDSADRRSGGGGNRAQGFRPRGSNVGVEGVWNGVCDLVGVAGIGRGDGVVAPRLVTRQDV